MIFKYLKLLFLALKKFIKNAKLQINPSCLLKKFLAKWLKRSTLENVNDQKKHFKECYSIIYVSLCLIGCCPSDVGLMSKNT